VGGPVWGARVGGGEGPDALWAAAEGRRGWCLCTEHETGEVGWLLRGPATVPGGGNLI
jgi:hypothetical protein